MLIQPKILETVKPRTIKNNHIGEVYSRGYDRETGLKDNLRVIAQYTTIVLCKNDRTGFFETFNLGDLVQMGKEPEWDYDFGEVDPRLRL